MGFLPKFLFCKLQRNLITFRLISVINYDCTYYDEKIFSIEEYFNRKKVVYNPRSWNMNRFEDALDNTPIPINRNLAYSDFNSNKILFNLNYLS